MAIGDSPTNREFGELTGEVKALSTQMTRMEDANSREHTAVMNRIDSLASEIRRALEAKASKDWVAQIDTEVDSLKTSRDQATGAFRLGGILKGVATFIIAAFGYILGGGKHP
jgi:hypothetical protein